MPTTVCRGQSSSCRRAKAGAEIGSAPTATVGPMANRRALVLACFVLAAMFVILAAVYFTRSAQDLPGFLPGHQAGLTRHHTKHGIAMLGLAVVSLLGAWMLGGSSPKSETSGG